MCVKCHGFMYLNGLYCAPDCPFLPQGKSCIFPNELLFQLPFNSRQTPYKDVAKGYLCYLTQEAHVVFQQGLQLNGSQFVQLPPNPTDSRDLVLPASFRLELWVRARSGCVLSKTVSGNPIIALCLNATWILTIQLYRTSQSISLLPDQALYESALRMPIQLTLDKTSAWTKLAVSVLTRSLDSDFAVQVTLSVNAATISSQIFNNSFFRDFSSSEGQAAFLLGAGPDRMLFLEGSIAEVLLLSGTAQAIAPTCLCDLCATSGFCLSPCLVNQYLEADECRPCNSSCMQGCLRASDCSLNLDPLCAIYEEFDQCLGCKFLAEFYRGTCQCIKNAHFILNTCVCKEGFQLNKGECAPCLSYYQAAEVSVSATANTFVLTFARPLQPSLRTCMEVFTPESMALLGIEPQCHFRISSIKVILGTHFRLRQANLTLNALNVFAAKRNCSFSAEALQVFLQLPLPPPPVAILSLPEQFSISCRTKLTLSGANSRDGVRGSLLFSWNISTELGIINANFESFSLNSNIQLPVDELQPGFLFVRLTVQDLYGQEDRTEGTVQLLNQSGLSVEIEGGSAVSFLSDYGSVFRCRVKQGCGQPPYSYSWTINQSDPSNLQRSQGILKVTPCSLRPGVHFFTCTASDSAGSVGFKNLQLTIHSSPLRIYCDRTAGVTSASLPLRVDCSNSTDPDDPSIPVAGDWTCETNGMACKTTTGAQLSLSAGLVLQVPERTLTEGQYLFTLTVSQGNRKHNCTLTFQVVSTSGLQVHSCLPSQRISNQHPYQVVLLVKAPSQTQLIWNEPFNSSKPFLQLPPSLLANGDMLELHFTVQLMSSLVTVRMEVQVNSGPIVGVLNVDPKAGLALATSFRLHMSEALDPDGSDYPLNFAFGFTTLDTYSFLSLPQAVNYFSTLLFEEVNQVFCKICDSAESCSYAYNTVSVQKAGRALESTDLMHLFDQQATDPDQVPASCTVFAHHTALSAALWRHILKTLQATLQSSLEEQELLATLTCLESLASQSLASVQLLLSSVSQVIQRYRGPMYENIFTAVLRIFSKCQPAQIEVPELLSVLDEVVSVYGNTLLPDQPPFLFSSYFLNISGLRTIASSTAYQEIGVMLPAAFLSNTSLHNTTVLDVWVCHLESAFYPAAVTSVRLRQAGSFNGLIWTNASTKDLPEASTSFNVTVPVFNVSVLEEPTTCLCWKQSSWVVADSCSFTSFHHSIQLTIRCLGIFTIVPASIGMFQPDLPPELDILKAKEPCTQIYTPLYLAAALIGLASIISALLWATGKRHNPGNVPPEQSMEPPSTPQVLGENNAEISYSTVHIGEVAQPRHPIFLEGHFLLGLLLRRKPEYLIGLTAALLVELGGLGVIKVLDNRDLLSMHNYASVMHFLWASLLGCGVSLMQATGFWSRNGKWHRVTMVCGVVVCMLSTSAVGVAVSRLCETQVESWLLVFACTTLSEVLVLESLVATYRRLLL